MRNHRPLRLLAASLSALSLAACATATEGSRVREDSFDNVTLRDYVIHNSPTAWAVANGHLVGGPGAEQSVVIRKGSVMRDGWVETETDWASDGGLVLRFQGPDHYYLLAIRDDTYFGWANLEVYRALPGNVFERLDMPKDVSFPRGKRARVRFEASGNRLRAYLNNEVVLQVVDDTYATGGFGLRHDNTRGIPNLTSRFDLLRWQSR